MPVTTELPMYGPPAGFCVHWSVIVVVTLGACAMRSASVQVVSLSTAPVTVMFQPA
jgi:hypothetical protein